MIKNIMYYSTKPAGSFYTSIILLNKDLGCIYSKEINDKDVWGYCKCLRDLGIKYISKSDLGKKISDQLGLGYNNLLSDLSLEQREQM